MKTPPSPATQLLRGMAWAVAGLLTPVSANIVWASSSPGANTVTSAWSAAPAMPGATGTSTLSAPGNLEASRSLGVSRATTATPHPTAAQLADYARNEASDVFGAQLFTGTFSAGGAMQFNPDYALAVGDQIQVRLWGAFAFEQTLAVDPQGNIFLPHAGPVQVLGVRNAQLGEVVAQAVRSTFRNNVNSYASLAAAQPVRVFVGGNVSRPGLYSGTSMDSVLRYLDLAGGIDPQRGSYLQVHIKRGELIKASINLYEFLLNGTIPLVQLADGDVIFVPPYAQRISASGLVANGKHFEFAQPTTVLALMQLAKPLASATHVRVLRNTGLIRNAEYYALSDSAAVTLADGDVVEFTADQKPGTITVRVEGEHDSAQEYVLPYGANMGALLAQIKPRAHADMQSLQLFRESVKARQKEMLDTSLYNLEMSLLTARSGSSDEARLRREEADLSLQWVERARKIEPIGQVQIAQAQQLHSMLLENGDVVRIPRKDDLVLVSGEVLFPNALAYDSSLDLDHYIERAGGFSQQADNARVVIARRDGSFTQVNTRRFFVSAKIQAGDQILVLPKVDEKQRQFWKDMTQIVYQIAVSAKVVLGL